MKSMDVRFKNRPNDDGTLSTFTINNCLISPTGSPAATRPQVTIHLPKDNTDKVNHAWVEYEGENYHVIGEAVPRMKENTPTNWNRYVIAEKLI